MATLTIERGQKALVKISKINYCSKTVKFGNVLKCKHDIFIEDKNGNTAVCEHFTEIGEEPTFEVNRYQWVHCVSISPAPYFTMDIKPTEPPGESREPVSYQPKTTALPTSSTNKEDSNPYTANGGGKMITFATAYAKDLLAAEVSKQPEGYRITEEDIDRMMGWAAKICAATDELVNF